MGDELKATRELEGLKETIEAVADYMEDNGDIIDGTVDADLCVGILRSILSGATPETIIERHHLEVEEDGI